MESRHVSWLEMRGRRRDMRCAAGPAKPMPDDPEAEMADADDSALAALGHRELDGLLLCEARRARDSLLNASAALHAASSVALDAVAARREEREDR